VEERDGESKSFSIDKPLKSETLSATSASTRREASSREGELCSSNSKNVSHFSASVTKGDEQNVTRLQDTDQMGSWPSDRQ